MIFLPSTEICHNCVKPLLREREHCEQETTAFCYLCYSWGPYGSIIYILFTQHTVVYIYSYKVQKIGEGVVQESLCWFMNIRGTPYNTNGASYTGARDTKLAMWHKFNLSQGGTVALKYIMYEFASEYIYKLHAFHSYRSKSFGA